MLSSDYVIVTNERTGRVLGRRVTKARTLASRLVGLLAHSTLPEGEGLWLEPCASIHMFFMRFAIDAVFVDREARVTRAVESLRPWRIAFGGRSAHAVVELPVGTVTGSATRVGDRLRVEAI